MIRVLWHMLLGHDVSVPDGDTAQYRKAMADDWPPSWSVYYCRRCEKGWGKPHKRVLPFSPTLNMLVLGMVVVAVVIGR